MRTEHVEDKEGNIKTRSPIVSLSFFIMDVGLGWTPSMASASGYLFTLACFLVVVDRDIVEFGTYPSLKEDKITTEKYTYVVMRPRPRALQIEACCNLPTVSRS